jgi:phosphoribosylformimino-5-aminoimidazole carboxamide ribotide isomerase
MRVIPAIDLRGGLCVRLQQGDYQREMVFSDDPVAMARRWEDEGAELIHLVDLDGAKEGRPVNVEPVRRIVDRVSVPCQLGGGVRDQETIAAWLDAGLLRVIVGTAALRDPDWFRAMIVAYPGQLVLGLDARQGRVAVSGWLETSEVEATALARAFDRLPLAAIVYTDIGRDGTLEGPNLAATAELARGVKTPIIASGGVGSLDDLDRLAELPLAGCIVGRALYEGRFTLAQAIAQVRTAPPPEDSR